jgi:hypothetical protein
VYVYTNGGSGIYNSNASFSVKAATNVFTADINGDGWVDLIVESVTNYQNLAYEPVTTISIWTNNGSGTFGSNVTFTVGAIGERVMDVKAATLFGDGQTHLVFSVNDVYHNAGYLMVYTNNGAGGFGSNATVSVGSGLNPLSFAVADLNGDGALDLVSANYGNGSGNGSLSGSLMIFTNAGNGIQSGSFLSNSMPVVNTNNNFVVAADLYRTGQPQLIVNSRTNSLLILTNNGSGGFGSNAVVSGFTANTFNNFVTAPPIAADIFGNGSPAIIVGGWNGQNGQNWLTVLTNNGANVFGTNASYSTGLLGYPPQQIVAADVNGDAKLDLIAVYAYLGGSSWNITVLTNNGSGGFATNVTLTLNGYAQLAVADVNGDGRPDLVAAYYYNGYSQLTVFTNLSPTGASPFYSAAASHTYQITSGASPISLVAADVNGDGKVDMIIANNNNPGTLSVMTNNGYGVFALASSPVVGAYPHAVTAADVNGDGKVDLISANWGLPTNTVNGQLNWGTLSVLTNNGSGVFTNTATFSTGKGPTAVVTLDVNSDGRPDLIAANYTGFTNSSYSFYAQGNSLSILLNTSNFVNTVAVQTAPTASPITYGQPLSAANFDFAAGVVTNEAGAAIAGAFAFTTYSNTSIISAGTPNVPITFTATPPTDYQPVTFNVSVTVTQLVVILKGSRAYDGTTNVVHGSLSVSNLVGSDFAVLTAGSVGLATANVGTNSITSTNGLFLAGTAAGNYTLSGVSGAVTITKAINTVLIYSSLNPSAYGTSVNFTSTLPAYATGTMQFQTNGILFDTETLTGGSATSVATTSLPAGTTGIQAFYSGDANNQSTASYTLYQVVNLPQFSGVVVGSGGLVMSGSFGLPGATYYILSATNLSLPVSQWTPVYTNQFDVNGNYNYTNPITTAPSVYFILQVP